MVRMDTRIDLADLEVWYIGEHDRLMAHWRCRPTEPDSYLELDDWIGDFEATLKRCARAI